MDLFFHLIVIDYFYYFTSVFLFAFFLNKLIILNYLFFSYNNFYEYFNYEFDIEFNFTDYIILHIKILFLILLNSIIIIIYYYFKIDIFWIKCFVVLINFFFYTSILTFLFSFLFTYLVIYYILFYNHFNLISFKYY